MQRIIDSSRRTLTSSLGELKFSGIKPFGREITPELKRKYERLILRCEKAINPVKGFILERYQRLLRKV